ncbi:hypothetical protein MKEN_01101600 [Mycena kentingensis (nom. inval.)]|nr:hypothetical protein MKEN_01101600 [Mycena kentingensis (nom. inval.)]
MSTATSEDVPAAQAPVQRRQWLREHPLELKEARKRIQKSATKYRSKHRVELAQKEAARKERLAMGKTLLQLASK